ncbi:ribosome small subunit-dependent GTPase A [Sulfuritalea sp.]|uniref:ribosome small subunit-dependent GTPase A n=1 Tax=Sulfuritalea sp. TaxID=2480090 RepID=UPI001AC40F51|nr:ribosome small subunit-dependent GTPase A [Sulfuritalea sp.]MBN8476190.1 ribosome small subunit-dependent GTPase A [Sulfuritalea sp.]
MNAAGTIVAAFGRHYEIELADGRIATGYPKGKKSLLAVGDEVQLSPDGQIMGHAARRSLLYRSDAYRQKLIAANATQLLLVVATDPSFSDMLLSRALVAAEHEGLTTTIVLNKCDLAPALPAARKLLAPYIALGCRVVELSAKFDPSPLLPLLAGESSVLVGQSGMGKSTLTNALVPGAAAPTRELSTALDSGKHTTTYARLYKLPGDTCPGGTLIDSPGLQEFGLKHLSAQEIEYGFAEFRPFLGQCRFRDCQHDAEPGCAIKQGLAAGIIHPRRIEHFHQFISESRHGSH